jgi:hypothetical protein
VLPVDWQTGGNPLRLRRGSRNLCANSPNDVRPIMRKGHSPWRTLIEQLGRASLLSSNRADEAGS